MLSLFNTGYGLQDQLDGVKNGIAIVATNNTHIAITSGQYVYIQDHGTLAEGLYRATANIAANGTLSGSNVTAVSGGGLNALNSKTTPPDANLSNFGLFVVFGSVPDGQNYYTNSIYVPIGYKIDENSATIPANVTISRTGCYYRLYTADSSLAGKGTNIICKLIPDT